MAVRKQKKKKTKVKIAACCSCHFLILNASCMMFLCSNFMLFFLSRFFVEFLLGFFGYLLNLLFFEKFLCFLSTVCLSVGPSFSLLLLFLIHRVSLKKKKRKNKTEKKKKRASYSTSSKSTPFDWRETLPSALSRSCKAMTRRLCSARFCSPTRPSSVESIPAFHPSSP
jgi:predicted membrane protein